jgi:hypothetical protein
MFRHWKTRLTRACLFAASFATSALLMAALGAAFHGVSSEPWLRDSPSLQRLLARCEARTDRGDRRACVRDGLSLARSGRPDADRMAALGAGAADPPAP